MGTKKLKDLKVADLKRELEERDQDTSGKKNELLERLSQVMRENGEDPDNHVFEVDGGTNELQKALKEVAENSRSLKEKMVENSRSLKEDVGSLKEEMVENSRSLKEEMVENSRSLKEEMVENSRSLKEEMAENSRSLKEDVGSLKEEIADNSRRLKQEMLENARVLKEEIDQKLLENSSNIEQRSKELEERIKGIEIRLGQAHVTGGSNCDTVYNSDISKNGTLSSLSYPTPYPARITCRYEFQGRGKERVQIVFQDFNLYQTNEDSKDCDNQDSLIAFVLKDGRMEKIDSYCGSILPKPIMSNGPRLKLELRSVHGSRYSRGFKATYSFTESIKILHDCYFGIRMGVQMPEYPCAFVFTSNKSRSGLFHSPNYPGFYPRDTECHFFFHGNNTEKVRLHFNYFDVEGVLPRCETTTASDYVEFSNFMVRDRNYERHCGQLKEFDVESDRKFFRVTFKSNDRLDGTGFNASYTFIDVSEAYTTMSGSISRASTKGCYLLYSFIFPILRFSIHFYIKYV
ncbi:cubilin [Holotrichia oblita]|uniref:Cubilin n=1 Tax=Holotrichia oblita TaxID=644536 RepID=A0ACB9SY48_HOLOL|nr:cubilin [Holotrichia oblita]